MVVWTGNESVSNRSVELVWSERAGWLEALRVDPPTFEFDGELEVSVDFGVGFEEYVLSVGAHITVSESFGEGLWGWENLFGSNGLFEDLVVIYWSLETGEILF